jgi:pimeloyl-ACP methyl ester carboxylesterase
MRYGDLAADSIGADNHQPALVLLHGMTFDRRHWAPLLAEPAIAGTGRRIVAFDLPGHGESPRRGSYGLADLVGVLHGAISEAGLDGPVLAGHSVGAGLATGYAARYPVSGVVNIDLPLVDGGFGDILRGLSRYSTATAS